MGAKQLPTAPERGADVPRRAPAAGPVDARRDRIRDRGAGAAFDRSARPQFARLVGAQAVGHDRPPRRRSSSRSTRSRRRRAAARCVLLSDGSDRYSKATAAEALDRARRSDVMIYPIAIGAHAPRALRAARDADRRPLVPAEDARGAERHRCARSRTSCATSTCSATRRRGRSSAARSSGARSPCA